MGSGHTVTALYEIIPGGVKSEFYAIDDLKYQSERTSGVSSNNMEWLTVKLRYKKQDEIASKLRVHTVEGRSIPLTQSSNDFRWTASVAGFGMLLTGSQYVVDWSYDEVVRLAEGARGEDKQGYRSEFLSFVKSYSLMAKALKNRHTVRNILSF